MPLLSTRCALFALTMFCLSAPQVALAQWGTITGEFVWDEDDIPEQKVLHKKGANVKDAAVCADEAVYDQSLVVSEDGGIANIFIYTRKVDKIHPDLAEPPKEPLVFDQKNCTFKPHAMFIRAGSKVLVKSDDGCGHNTRTSPLRNDPINFLVTPNNREGVPVTDAVSKSEILPIEVKCDFHPWMTAYWLILDHPYATVSDGDGKFTIKNLPVGTHEFRIWHEKVGYLNRKFMVEVKAGENELDPIYYASEDFKKKG